MPEKNMGDGQPSIAWQAPEYERHERSKSWYIVATAASLLMLLFSFLTSNFLFAIIIIIASLVVILHDSREPDMVGINLTDEGVTIGKRFCDYDDLKNFSIVYKPRQGAKNLYCEFKNAVKPRLSVPLLDENPLPIREFLLKYLPEDLERTDQPLSEVLAKFFKL